MKKTLSILVPTTPDRSFLFKKLIKKLCKQISENNLNEFVKIIPLENDGEKNVGYYRNELLKMAETDFLCFFDDDDLPSDDYVISLFNAIQTEDISCVNFNIEVQLAGRKIPMVCSNKNLKYEQLSNKFIRPTTHISCIKSEIAKRHLFDETREKGSDVLWSMEMVEELKDKKEIYLDKTLYYYRVLIAKKLLSLQGEQAECNE